MSDLLPTLDGLRFAVATARSLAAAENRDPGPCRSCNGDGKTFAFVTREHGCGAEVVDCTRCRGAGSETHEAELLRDLGDRERRRRVDAGLNLRERAAQLGVASVELALLESGSPPLVFGSPE